MKLQFRVERLQLPGVGRAGDEFVDGHAHRNIAMNGDELAAEPCVLRLGEQSLPRALAGDVSKKLLKTKFKRDKTLLFIETSPPCFFDY